MNKHSNKPILPDQTNYEQALDLSFKLAVENLLINDNLEILCKNSGSVLISDKQELKIVLVYLNKTCEIIFPDIKITLENGEQPLDIKDKILILHYLLRSKGTSLSQKLIAFQELQEGAQYYASFVNRSIKPLISNFGADPEKLIEISSEMGGVKSGFGDVSVTIPAFPRIPVTYVMWKGDDEFPSNASILFNSTVLDYLPAEDITVLCQTITWRMVKSLTSNFKFK